MNFITYEVILDEEKSEVESFLNGIGLQYEDVDQTIYIKDENTIIGTVSSKGEVIKCLGVNESYRSQNISSILITEIIRKLHQQNIHHYFVYTTYNNISIFKDFGFKQLVEYKDICLLEAGLTSINDYFSHLIEEYKLTNELKGCIVMNLNPLTNGHLYLIEKAAQENKTLLLFLVSEDRSIFPFRDRLRILSEAIKHLDNVVIIPTGRYIISNTTFPTYFIKDKKLINELYSNIDVLVFKKYIMPLLNIEKRYVGTEPYCIVTNSYNEALKKYLGDQLVIIDRLNLDNESKAISATIVRQYIKEDRIDEITNLVPDPTYKYILENKEVLMEKLND